ncbi:hypothetical protein ACQUW5_12540 [Legionella sp. CNM-1927-20]|uniref:hypothetical protein n=1 Tax=Legionella sp. CNM-1927-20 TaxID=3422221 RepID=UPI00403AFE24
MKQYMWYHPHYFLETSVHIVAGQMENARKYGYIILEGNELHKVKREDHLTIVGHSTPPKLAGIDLDEDEDLNDTGYYIQGENAEQCVQRLKQAGLIEAPQVLSLECCRAGIEKGIAEQLSSQPFFKDTLIEANPGGISRSSGHVICSLVPDIYGRMVMRAEFNPWVFLLSGQPVLKLRHNEYKIEKVLETLEQNCAGSNPSFTLNKAGLFFNSKQVEKVGTMTAGSSQEVGEKKREPENAGCFLMK